jgi:hypothetical protein
MESLMERMDCISEELKAKDILLKSAKPARETEERDRITEELKAKDIPLESTEQQARGTEQLFQESSPLPLILVDEDVYMADNETNKKSELSGNGMRKGKGKGKGKARQIEDEDEEMTNEEIDDSETKSQPWGLSDMVNDGNFDNDVLEAEGVRPLYYT